MPDRLPRTLARILPPDRALLKKAQARLDSLTKPQGSLGRLEELARRVVLITGNTAPKIKRKVIFTLAADHGVAVEGVSAYPQAVTAQMVENFLRGGAAVNVLARHVGAEVMVADVGVCQDLGVRPGLLRKRIRPGTWNLAAGPAMGRDEAISVVEEGIDLVEGELGRGLDLIGTGEMGIANTTASSAIVAALTGAPVEAVTGRGTGVDEAGYRHKVGVIRRALEKNRPDPSDPLDVLAKVGGLEIGGLVGVILAGAANRIPVVVDGFIAGTSALLAVRIKPEVREFLIAAHCSAEPGHRLVLRELGLEPLLDLGMRLGEGTGAALAMGVIEGAMKLYREMATFKEAGVSERGGES